jgi:hypothetical protein
MARILLTSLKPRTSADRWAPRSRLCARLAGVSLSARDEARVHRGAFAADGLYVPLCTSTWRSGWTGQPERCGAESFGFAYGGGSGDATASTPRVRSSALSQPGGMSLSVRSGRTSSPARPAPIPHRTLQPQPTRDPTSAQTGSDHRPDDVLTHRSGRHCLRIFLTGIRGAGNAEPATRRSRERSRPPFDSAPPPPSPSRLRPLPPAV